MAVTHRPGRDDLARVYEAFRARESRDLFYRAATALVRLARDGTVDLTTGGAVAVLLRTWDSAYYRYHRNAPGSVGAAKALHLLAPQFMPLRDGAIAAEYTGGLGRTGTNAGRYLEFTRECREQAIAVSGDAVAPGENILKAPDEYNYCASSKGWITP